MEKENLTITEVLSRFYEFYCEKTGQTNTIFSPLSVYTALKMLAEGLEGQSLLELNEKFSFSSTRQSEVQKFHTIVAEYSSGTADEEGVSLRMNCSILTGQEYKIEDQYVKTLATKYKAITECLNFSSPSALSQFNNRITELTRGLLKNTLSALDPKTACILLNTVYFKGSWALEFPKKYSNQQSFYRRSGKKVKVDFMRNKCAKVAYFEHNGRLTVSIPYKGQNKAFVIEMHKKGEHLVSNFGEVIRLANNQQLKEVDLAMPKFKAELNIQIRQLLELFGVRAIFLPQEDDFRQICSSEKLKVSEVIHQAFIQVDEKGTEAAAATLIIKVPKSAINFPFFSMKKTIEIDKPFHFHIVDCPRNMILFSGMIEDPTAVQIN